MAEDALTAAVGWAPELQTEQVCEKILLAVFLGERALGARLDEKAVVRRHDSGRPGSATPWAGWRWRVRRSVAPGRRHGADGGAGEGGRIPQPARQPRTPTFQLFAAVIFVILLASLFMRPPIKRSRLTSAPTEDTAPGLAEPAA